MSNKIEIYHNKRCSKSRCALDILNNRDEQLIIHDYLKTPPTKKQLKDLLAKLGIKASELVRKKEPVYLEKFKDKKFNETEWITILTENPILIERPIVVDGYGAIIARPPELLEEFLKRKKPLR
jgi:arsenate reductase